MDKKVLILCAALLGPLCLRHPTAAFLAPGSIGVTFEILVNRSDGSEQSACAWSRKIQEPWSEEWWLSVQRDDASEPDAAERGASSIRCEQGSLEEALSKTGTGSGRSLLTVGASTLARIGKEMEDERVVVVRVNLDGEGPAATEIRRDLYFTENEVALIPIYVPDPAGGTQSGLGAVFLRIHTRLVAEQDSATRYGSIWLTVGDDGDQILLDGNAVDTIPREGEVMLRNVPVGWHKVSWRDASGHDSSEILRVESNRTVVVDLSPSTSPETKEIYGLKALGENEQGYEEFQRAADGAVVVKIPAGEFLMGNESAERSPPEHRVYVSEFLMDKIGVTWAQYKRFASATGMPLPPHEPYWGILDDHPVVYVTWEESKEYCEWAGGRLPTEAEREKAARGTDGRMYPWGGEEPTPEHGVYRRPWGREATAAVATHPAGLSPYGLHDMGGNVWEWCSDWYDKDYLANSPYRNPKGPPSGRTHVLRGGSWDSRPDVLSASVRNWGHRGYREGDFGFRCAMNVPE